MSRREDTRDGNSMVSVNVDDFTRTRDSVIVSLATLQSAVSDLSRAYINHANTVLNRGTSGDIAGITSSLYENGLLAGQRPLSPGGKSDTGDKKKRKRAPHDPNAPKRALTPYFLFMHHNRRKISDQLGTSVRPQDVADEGKRRWDTMGEEEKQIWRDLYGENLAIYKEKKAAYQAGRPIPDEDWKDPSEELLQAIQEAQGASHPQEPEQEEPEEQAVEEESESEDEEESSESEKEPTPPPPVKRRRDADKPVSTPPTKMSSPEKRKKLASASKANREAPATVEKPKKSGLGALRAVAEESRSDKKRSKKKRRSDVFGSD